MIFSLAVAVCLALGLRVLRPHSIVGPDRLPGTGRLAGLAFAMLTGLGTWIFAQGIYAQMILAEWHKAGHTGTPDLMTIFTPHQFGVLQIVPPVIAFVVMLVADQIVQPGLPLALGLAPRLMGRGIALGILGIIMIFPPILWTSMIAEQVYRAVRFAHPNEHPLLKSLGETTESSSQLMLLLSATLVAPLFEELLFRGHLQTLLRQGLLAVWWRTRQRTLALAAVPVEPVDPTQPTQPIQFLPYQAPALPMPPMRGPFPAWPSWVAVILTSLLFMSVHPLWSFPPIFILSLGLGYIYERTGNLWASITVHLLFNSLNTAQFILLMHRH